MSFSQRVSQPLSRHLKRSLAPHDFAVAPCRLPFTSIFHNHDTSRSPASSPRPFSTTSPSSAVAPPRSAPSRPSRNPKLLNRDRGPKSKEDTQTDFAALNVLGNTANPSTSVDICITDGFMLDSGLRIDEGDGVILTSSEAFVWRPWMAAEAAPSADGKIVHGTALRKGKTETERTGGVVNKLGQFEIAEEAWGLFGALWPRPDMLIVGTGPSIRPLAPATRKYLESLGMRLEILDTRNAASHFNLLATERGVTEIAAALVPIGFGEK